MTEGRPVESWRARGAARRAARSRRKAPSRVGWVLLRARFGISFFLEGPVLSASVGPVPVNVLGAHFDSSFFLEGVVLTASEGTYSGCSIFPWDRFGNSFVFLLVRVSTG